ncbi:rhodanese-like domain-containing protein [Geomonas sp.]|uniref:rhodanese-like domain-containing protein n=1 Tax=Geomonas sp. TaxID=2651584 RepID=UPI002B474F54|nr:rhodanese-like domain-containing protein [Geomonas sp.]HJV36605.1 rhodanese-like domain-containing protein [Geomonas sp.]
MMSELTVGPEWVREQMKRGEAVFFVEVRHAGDWDLAVQKARGALRLTSDDGQRQLDRIPREGTVVVYSTAPNDRPAEALVMLLSGAGYSGARLLAGGFKAYLSAGLPVEEIGEGSKMQRLRGL